MEVEVPKIRHLVLIDIAQYHEAFNGTGYPRKLAGNRICIEAQLLALADLLVYMISVKPGEEAKTPQHMFAELDAMLKMDPSKSTVDPELLKKIIELFKEPNS